jgi:hypothetical protein
MARSKTPVITSATCWHFGICTTHVHYWVWGKVWVFTRQFASADKSKRWVEDKTATLLRDGPEPRLMALQRQETGYAMHS